MGALDGQRFVYSTSDRRVAIGHSIAGILSCLTASTLILHLSYIMLQPVLQRRQTGTAREPESNALKRQVSLFLIFLFMADLLQSVTGLMQIRWASKGYIDVNSAACRTQGVALMAGDLGVSYYNVVMAVHTFLTIITLRSISMRVAVIVIAIGQIFMTVLTLIGPLVMTDERGRFFGIAGLWCFISDAYVSPRFWLHYFIMYLSILIIFVVYIWVFWKLRMRQRTSIRTESQVMSNPLGDQTQVRASHYNSVSYKMLSYPTSYAIIVLPISIGRLMQVTGNQPPQEFLNFGIGLLMLSGFVNGVIYVLTRKTLSPFQYWHTPRPRLSFLRRDRPSNTPVIWVQTERQRHEGLDSKYSVELGDSGGRADSTVKVGSSGQV
ncbi:family A G protein-coupled receptor-like protein [Auriculariales sp. MPI-PUGE-AT-0066]|nr:family A G protein-coupled receptor-like protein [Auriculariales sp. MPI-PUGE-AT-0066]